MSNDAAAKMTYAEAVEAERKTVRAMLGDALCCDAFLLANMLGTDNESYGCLIYGKKRPFMMGDGLPPIKFCPWCGAPK